MHTNRQIFLFLPFYQSYKQADVVLLATFNFKPRPLQLPFVVFIAWSCGLRFWVALQKQKSHYFELFALQLLQWVRYRINEHQTAPGWEAGGWTGSGAGAHNGEVTVCWSLSGTMSGMPLLPVLPMLPLPQLPQYSHYFHYCKFSHHYQLSYWICFLLLSYSYCLYLYSIFYNHYMNNIKINCTLFCFKSNFRGSYSLSYGFISLSIFLDTIHFH